MALNKRRSLGSASSTSAAPVKTDSAKTSEATAERGNGSDFTAIQTALEAIVNSIAELAKKIESTESAQAKLAERLDAIEAAMDEDGVDTEGVGYDEDEDGEDVTPDDIDFEKVSTILHDMGDDEQKEVLSAAMKKLGVKRLRLPDLRKNPEQLFAVAEVLNEDYEVDVDDMLK